MRLHLVDGTYELFRAHFSPRPGHTAPDGMDAKATVGIMSSLLALLHDKAEAVSHIAVAFDNPIRSFRNELFAGYKTEEGVPPELLAQFDLAEEAVRALGVTVWSMKDHEADDALATAAARWAPQVEQVRLLSRARLLPAPPSLSEREQALVSGIDTDGIIVLEGAALLEDGRLFFDISEERTA